MRPPVDASRIRQLARRLGRVAPDRVDAMLERGLVDRTRLAELFEAIEPELFRYPAIDGVAFRRKVRDALGGEPGPV